MEKFLSAMEARAAHAIEAVVAGNVHLTDEMKTNIATFMVATHIRLPQHVAMMRITGPPLLLRLEKIRELP